MNCLHIASGDLWAGAEVSAHQLLRELQARPGVSVAAIVLNPGTLATRLAADGVRTWVLDEGRAGFAAIARQTLRTALSFQPDVVHTHRYKEHLLGALVAARTGASHIRTAHGLSVALGWSRGPVGVGAAVDEALADWQGSTWIAVTEDLARRMAGLRRSIHVVPNGIRAEVLPPRRADLLAACGIPGAEAWIVGFAGRLERVKRPDRFLRVLAQLPAELAGRRVMGAVLGDGRMAGELRGWAHDLGLAQRVAFLGHRDDAEGLVAALDLLLVPSDHEGLPMVVLEAMRAQVPVAGSAVGGMREALGDGAWLFAPHDESGLAAGVTTLLSDPAARAATVQAAQRRFHERFVIARVAERILALYEQVMPESRMQRSAPGHA